MNKKDKALIFTDAFRRDAKRRRAAIVRLYLAGKTQVQIAYKYDVSRQRIHQILKYEGALVARRKQVI